MAFYNGYYKKIVIYLKTLKQSELVVHWFLFFDQNLLVLFFKHVFKLPMSYDQKELENVTCTYVLILNLFIFSLHCKNMIKIYIKHSIMIYLF